VASDGYRCTALTPSACAVVRTQSPRHCHCRVHGKPQGRRCTEKPSITASSLIYTVLYTRRYSRAPAVVYVCVPKGTSGTSLNGTQSGMCFSCSVPSLPAKRMYAAQPECATAPARRRRRLQAQRGADQRRTRTALPGAERAHTAVGGHGVLRHHRDGVDGVRRRGLDEEGLVRVEHEDARRVLGPEQVLGLAPVRHRRRQVHVRLVRLGVCAAKASAPLAAVRRQRRFIAPRRPPGSAHAAAPYGGGQRLRSGRTACCKRSRQWSSA